jgi:hypothetical protein
MSDHGFIKEAPMGEFIDDLARALAGARSRRRVLRALGGGFAGALLASLLPGQAAGANAKPKARRCKKDGQCRDGQVCTNGACATTCNQFTGAPCAGGCRCNFAGICTAGPPEATNCTVNAECPPGSLCLFFGTNPGPSRCAVQCAGTAECPTGEFCEAGFCNPVCS